MLMLLFHAADQTYAIDCNQIQEVVPLVDIEKIPQSKAPVLGFINRAGQPITIFDLSEMISGEKSVDFLSTRIIFLLEQVNPDKKPCFGLVVEKAIEVKEIEESAFSPINLNVNDLSYLVGIASVNDQTIQKVDVAKLCRVLNSSHYADRK